MPACRVLCRVRTKRCAQTASSHRIAQKNNTKYDQAAHTQCTFLCAARACCIYACILWRIILVWCTHTRWGFLCWACGSVCLRVCWRSYPAIICARCARAARSCARGPQNDHIVHNERRAITHIYVLMFYHTRAPYVGLCACYIIAVSSLVTRGDRYEHTHTHYNFSQSRHQQHSIGVAQSHACTRHGTSRPPHIQCWCGATHTRTICLLHAIVIVEARARDSGACERARARFNGLWPNIAAMSGVVHIYMHTRHTHVLFYCLAGLHAQV